MDPEQVREFRFTRAVVGLVQSPFLKGATLAMRVYSEMTRETKEG